MSDPSTDGLRDGLRATAPPRHAGVGAALAAAVLFGATTPLVKALSSSPLSSSSSSEVGANAAAALLYLGSGLGLWLLLAVKKARGATIAPIPTAARGRFAGAVVAGGVVAPVLLLLGLHTTTASTSSLLLNLEGVLTAAIAWVVFHENVDRRVFVGMVAIVVGGAVLSVDVSGGVSFEWGAVFVVGACAGWAIDNNLTQAASSADPLLVAGTKGAVAGAVNALVAVALSQPFPPLTTSLAFAVTGFVGYGLSLTLFVVALRHLGSARTGAYFSAAPFVGVAIAVVVLDDAVTARLVVAAACMGLGLWLHLSERHAHAHTHDVLEHEHEHEHDEHHQHVHDDGTPTTTKHTHKHTHAPLTHTHAHTPDLHHRHSH